MTHGHDARKSWRMEVVTHGSHDLEPIIFTSEPPTQSISTGAAVRMSYLWRQWAFLHFFKRLFQSELLWCEGKFIFTPNTSYALTVIFISFCIMSRVRFFLVTRFMRCTPIHGVWHIPAVCLFSKVWLIHGTRLILEVFPYRPFIFMLRFMFREYFISVIQLTHGVFFWGPAPGVFHQRPGVFLPWLCTICFSPPVGKCVPAIPFENFTAPGLSQMLWMFPGFSIAIILLFNAFRFRIIGMQIFFNLSIIKPQYLLLQIYSSPEKRRNYFAFSGEKGWAKGAC